MVSTLTVTYIYWGSALGRRNVRISHTANQHREQTYMQQQQQQKHKLRGPKRAHSDATFHRNAFLMKLGCRSPEYLASVGLSRAIRRNRSTCGRVGVDRGVWRWHQGDSLHINHIHILYNSFSASFGGLRSRRDLRAR